MHEKNENECCKSGSKNINTYLIAGIVILVFGILFFQSYQIKNMNAKISAITGNAAQDSIDMGGWTDDEKMMYEHHGTLPARLSGGKQQSQMVGGC